MRWAGGALFIQFHVGNGDSVMEFIFCDFWAWRENEAGRCISSFTDRNIFLHVTASVLGGRTQHGCDGM